MKVEQFNQEILKKIREDLNIALEYVRLKYGVDVEVGNISYDQKMFTTRLTVSIPVHTSTGKTLPGDLATAFAKNAEYYDLDPQWLGGEFTMQDGHTYVIVGLKPRSKKYPIVCEHKATGELFKFPADVVREYMIGKEN